MTIENKSISKQIIHNMHDTPYIIQERMTYVENKLLREDRISDGQGISQEA